MKSDDWLWRLRCIRREMESCLNLAKVRVAFTLKIHDQTFSSTEAKTFPYGRVVTMMSKPVAKFEHPESGALWFDLGREAFPFVICWTWEEGWSCHRSMPKEFFPKDGGPFFCETLGWCRWYYHDAETKLPKKTTFERLDSRLIDFEEAILEACDLAPAQVRASLGNLSLLGCWPTALFYLALKRAHPLLSAWGTHVPKHSEHRKNDDPTFRALNDRIVLLSPDLLTATKYAFDVLRRLAKDTSDSRQDQMKPGGRASRRMLMASGDSLFRPPEGATWEKVVIRFLDGERVSVNVGGTTGVFNYTHMGMADGRHAGPNLQWKLLESFATGNGILDWTHSDARRENQKRRETLAKNLQAFFRIEGDPFVAEGTGWRARFAVSSNE